MTERYQSGGLLSCLDPGHLSHRQHGPFIRRVSKNTVIGGGREVDLTAGYSTPGGGGFGGCGDHGDVTFRVDVGEGGRGIRGDVTFRVQVGESGRGIRGETSSELGG